MTSTPLKDLKGPIAWFAQNGVAANLLMVLILAGGVLTLSGLRREIFPELPTRTITVSVPYPGAAPEEVEEGVCLRIEEAVQSLEGVKQIRSTAAENMGMVVVEALEGTDTRKLLDEVKSRVDAIDTFPEETEQPIIAEMQIRSQVINVAVSANVDEASLRGLAERVRDDLLSIPGITQAELVGARPYELSVEISEDALRRHGITFDHVSQAIRRSSLDLPGGSIKTPGGEILLRTKGQAYRGADFESIPLLTNNDGTRVDLGDVAQVVDGFAETDQQSTFDGAPSITVQVFRVGEQDALDIAAAVHDYIASAPASFPEGVSLTAWQDNSEYLRGRQELLLKNGRTGFLLVFLVLALFLRLRLAFWVSLGIPISFLGAIALMPILGVSINLISLFAFIIVLGIVVDDAIVTGENIYRHHEQGVTGLQAAVRGTQEVAVPVTYAVLTTVAAFAPLLFVPGRTGQVMSVIPLIVIPTLLFSLVESKLILPNHLSHLEAHGARPGLQLIGRIALPLLALVLFTRGMPRVGLAIALAALLIWLPVGASRRVNDGWRVIQEGASRGLERFVASIYRPTLRIAIRWRYATAALFLAMLLVTVGMIGGGHVKFVFFPSVESDTIMADLTLPLGTPLETTALAVERLEASLNAVIDEVDPEGKGLVIRHVLSSVGDQPLRTAQSRGGPQATNESYTAAHLAEVAIELAPSQVRALTSLEIASRWRELTGSIPDAVELTFSASLFSAGEPINVQFTGPSTDELEAVAAKFKTGLQDYAGVIDISDSYLSGKQEVRLTLKPEAEALGISSTELARQVRQGFYGEEVQRIQRGRDEVKVMVRYPADQRRSLGNLERMRIRTPAGDEVPLSTVAEAHLGQGYAAIERTDRRRTLAVTGDIDPSQANANEVLAAVQASLLPEILKDHPRVRYTFEGEQQQQRETMGGLLRGFLLALLAIYALMAVPFKSYIQPLIVMTAIPFGLIGAIWGHVVRGMDLSMLSMFGIVALTGVVVNDSLVLVDFVNRQRAEGLKPSEAVLVAGPARFRAILLTTLTTMAGLTPMILEKSVQAQFLIPIAVSLAFGVAFATLITLVLVPVIYVMIEDVQRLIARALHGSERTPDQISA